ncbi:MAG: penicillin-binding protein 2 [Flavobacteriales bacterium]|nr:penicillin-binding protein 2 [Flavobacteriales bacterium]
MSQNQNRQIIISGIFALVVLIYILRLFYIQVLSEKYVLSADNQSIENVPQIAPRGIILDRNNKKIAVNEASYDLMITVKQLKNGFDTLKFCQLVDISRNEFEDKLKRIKAKRGYSYYKPQVFERQIDAESFSKIMDKVHLFNGIDIRKSVIRRNPYSAGAQAIGYLSEVGPSTLEKDSSYMEGELIGAIGIERTYEKYLRGQRGYKFYVKDVHNIIQEPYRDGEKDLLPVAGSDIQITMDIELQKYAERLMKNKNGAIVAIEPSSGEILTMVTSPTYDPNLLSGNGRSKNYKKLKSDTLKVFFNRALSAQYPPGSIFKLVQTLIGLENGDITEYSSFKCDKGLVGCHNHPFPANVKKAIQFSCNPYYYRVFQRIIQPGFYDNIFADSEYNLNKWHDQVSAFGLGQRLKVDIIGEKAGSVPDSKLYDKKYGHHSWAFSTIYSLSIGQGELLITPLQMANIASVIANKGFFYRPHFIKRLEHFDDDVFKEKLETGISREHFDPVKEGMYDVVNEPHGTARRARIKDIAVCGKTGTAENPHGEDHSIFIAFAPKDNPKIAISVYVENAGFGGTWAAPIASLIMEKYLRNTADSLKEKRIMEADLIHQIDP